MIKLKSIKNVSWIVGITCTVQAGLWWHNNIYVALALLFVGIASIEWSCKK